VGDGSQDKWRVDHCQVKRRLFSIDKVPGCSLGKCFAGS
jgi:hypothetical protein